MEIVIRDGCEIERISASTLDCPKNSPFSLPLKLQHEKCISYRCNVSSRNPQTNSGVSNDVIWGTRSMPRSQVINQAIFQRSRFTELFVRGYLKTKNASAKPGSAKKKKKQRSVRSSHHASTLQLTDVPDICICITNSSQGTRTYEANLLAHRQRIMAFCRVKASTFLKGSIWLSQNLRRQVTIVDS